MARKSYFVELVISLTGKFEHNRFPSGIVFAESVEDAIEIVLNKYKAIYESDLQDGGYIKVNCSWKQQHPTIKVVNEVADELLKHTLMRIHRGKGMPYSDTKAYDNKREVIEDAKRLNILWGEVYYEPNISGYIVQMHPYMRMPVTVKVFEGNTYEVYQSAIDWVNSNSMKQNYYRK